ncbi:MAG: hypothetical protein IJN34_05695, partial [Clostridia bacterium]|nr:hypothetical protein [Clostridia bacterium]
LIGAGYTPQEAIQKIGMVVEGINALEAAMRLAKQYEVEMPITFAADAIISGRITPADAVRKLMEREAKPETIEN